MRAVLDLLGSSPRVLVVDNGENRNLTLGSRNLAGVTLVPTREVNAFTICWATPAC